MGALAASVEPLGLALDLECSNRAQIVLRDQDGAAPSMASRVTVLVSFVDQRNNEVQLEVRSSEPMLTRGTRCESVAVAIQKQYPPLR